MSSPAASSMAAVSTMSASATAPASPASASASASASSVSAVSSPLSVSGSTSASGLGGMGMGMGMGGLGFGGGISGSSSNGSSSSRHRIFQHLNAIEAIPSPVLAPTPTPTPQPPRHAASASAATASNSVLAPPPTAATLASLEGPLLAEDVGAGVYGGYTVQRTLGIGAFSRVVLAVPPALHTLAGSPRAAAAHNNTAIASTGSGSDDGSTALTPRLQPAITLQSPLSPPHNATSFTTALQSHLRIRTASPPSSAVEGLPAQSSPHPHIPAAVSSGSGPSSNPRRLSVQTQLLDRPQLSVITGTQSSGSGSGSSSTGSSDTTTRASHHVYALKMLEREPCRTNQRMKVSWVREVEVLKHISHPSLIHLVRSFCTRTYNILVLEAVSGGELFDLVAQHHADIIAPREWLVRRLVGELANAVGWMHRVNLVHRDIKLENILLTKDLRSCQNLTPSSLPPYSSTSTNNQPQPLLKLTDFGLSRFIDPATPHLETRCGSEEYAAPELIMGRRYDGRKTDAWALGVVAYALLTGSLPFLEDLPGSGCSDSTDAAAGSGSGTGAGIGGREVSASVRETAAGAGTAAVLRDPRARKAHLLRIAKGDLRWPLPRNVDARDDFGLVGRADDQSDESEAGTQSTVRSSPSSSLTARNRLVTPAAQTFVARLLRRDAAKRSNVWDVWDEPWMVEGSFAGAGGPLAAGPESDSSSLTISTASMNSNGASLSLNGAVMPLEVGNSNSDDGGSDVRSFQRVDEGSAQGALFEVPLDPRVGRGRVWVDRWTTLRTEPLSAVARDD
ncbi:unnamed protein product [Tilletia controversa]|uniref:Uncharacterized protein n=3 Tax=Tilletia TaxID=13289 RepID=A0A9N8QCI1_9BASI|nr:hypothetical protein CF335_g5955 [Tilletia laevis]CAD6890829.1 unnamed protein product [Tilletia caries]CAD6912827.1 unnamed protein product [Tilletia controversa]CAD6919376.1 unnamed protein product [Tilletia controversa]CAD6923924.1 unnamed protein product [Tilletia caries]